MYARGWLGGLWAAPCAFPKLNFDYDVVVGSERDKGQKKSKSERRKRQYKHAIVQKAREGEINLNISKELRKLQHEDQTIQDLRKAKLDQVVEKHGLWYYLWAKKQQPEHLVEQLLLPRPYHYVVCKLAHSIPIAGHLGRNKTISRITQWFYLPIVFCDVQ